MNLYFVTGTTKGLGAALRDELIRDPDNLVIGVSRAPASSIAPINLHADFTDIASIGPAFSACEAYLKGRNFDLAVLFNNAGVVVPVDTFDQLDPMETADNVNINLVAPMVLTRLFANATRMCAKQRLVVNISSGAAKRPIAGWSVYCASKAGLEMATRAAAMEAASSDSSLAICSLAPGVVDTPMQAQVRGATEREFPDVARFRAMKADGVLRDAVAVARDMIKLIKEGKLTNGGNFDIRELLA
ncbi:MAG: SDR family NAD(P)-dependent oxidoreductase [Betaproteobacteria bacterium]|nr:SDR family NAD(P)-dependent oxidoreductase [Betaproteobacteria bacterium]